MPRYKLTITYDGTDFCGWQRQELLPPDPDPDARPQDQRAPSPSLGKLAAGETLPVREGEDRPRVALRTVQHVVEQAVSAVVRQPVTVLGASRTDAGVHARGQVAAFTCSGDPEVPGSGWPESRGTDRLLRALNGRLPDDVQVMACEPATPDFDPIRGATSKAYSYTLHVSPGHIGGLRPMWDRRYVHHVWEALDLSEMQAAAAHLVGEHDFAAFAAAGHGRLTTVRTVFACTVTEPPPAAEGRRLRIDIVGSGFLWNMVRIIAGTLVEAGRGRIAPSDIPAIITSRDRARAGPTLPPTGLCLEWVKYAQNA